MNKEQEMVSDFHRKFNFTANPLNEKPRLIPKYIARKRIKFLRQEVREFNEAVNRGDIIEIADALADIGYLLIGNCVAYGIDFEKIFAEIHRSNMSKERTMDRDGKAVKGPNYSPPNLKLIIEGE